MAKPTATLRDRRRLNRTDMAALLGVSVTKLDAMVRQGCPIARRPGRGKASVFNTLDVLRWRYGPREGAAGVAVVDPEKLTPADRKQWYDGEHKRRTLAEMDAGLIPAPEVAEATTAMHVLVADTLHRLPGALTVRAGLTPAQAAMVDQATREALADFTDRMSHHAPGLTAP